MARQMRRGARCVQLALWCTNIHPSRRYDRDFGSGDSGTVITERYSLSTPKSRFTGGINLGDPWAPPTATEQAWRDDEVEVRGPATSEFRSRFYEVWNRLESEPHGEQPSTSNLATLDPRVKVLTNRLGRGTGHVIRHAYLETAERAEHSIDISNPYFLPGPILLRVLRTAARHGRRVRVLVPMHSDVPLVALAMTSIYARLLKSGVELYAYRPRMLHAKTAIFDCRWTTTGSHNLDSLSWHFNLECNVLIDSEEFAQKAVAGFERDLADATRLDLAAYEKRSAATRFLGWFVALFRYFSLTFPSAMNPVGSINASDRLPFCFPAEAPTTRHRWPARRRSHG